MPNGEKAMRLDEGKTLYEDLARRIRDIPPIDNVVAVSDIEPTEEGVKIWLPETPPQAIQVPTYAEFQQLEQDVDAKVSDVQVNGTSVVSNGVANVPAADATTYGTVKVSSNLGVVVGTSNCLSIQAATAEYIKTGETSIYPLAPNTVNATVFYGLSKAAGVDLKNETVTLGTYPAASKSAIQTMLGVEQGVTFVETVTGTTPTITGQPNVRYICGEVSLLTITPPSAGTITVIFESGSTPTVLTLPNTVKFPEWVDISTLEANTTYEIIITDGVYGGVMSWAD